MGTPVTQQKAPGVYLHQMHVRTNYLRSSIPTNAVLVAPNDPGRVLLTIINLDTTNSIYIGFDDQITATRGIQVGPAGGGVNFSIRNDGELTAYAVFGLAVGGTVNVYIVETILDIAVDARAVFFGFPPSELVTP